MVNKIERAAIIAHGVVFHGPRPMRHHDLIQTMARLGVPTPINGTTVRGFLDTEGDFADRDTAKWIAWRADQISESRMDQGRVFCTEDLW